MTRRFLLWCGFSLSLCCRVFGGASGDPVDFYALPCDLVPDLSDQALPFRLEWKSQVISRWNEGVPREILMCSPDHDWPCKRLCYHPSGGIAEDADLEPYGEREEGRGRNHGASVEYYETGDIRRVCSYKHGLKDGLDRFFSENGRTIFEAEYRNGKLHGVVTVYWPSGAVCSEEHYADGVLHGQARTFYENGEN